MFFKIMNLNLFTFLIVLIGILASVENVSQPNLTASKDEVEKAINDLETKITTIKNDIKETETVIQTMYSSLKDDTFESLEFEEGTINSKINEIFQTCQNDKCKSCFEVQDNVNKSCEENENKTKTILDDAYKVTTDHVNFIVEALGEYDSKITTFRQILKSCKDNEMCISSLAVLVENYEKDAIDKDNSTERAKDEESAFETTESKNCFKIQENYSETCDKILDTIKKCVEDAATTTTTVTETTKNTSPTTQYPETTTKSGQTKVTFNVLIFISMLVITKILL